MNPRSTDCEADALTTTPSRRCKILYRNRIDINANPDSSSADDFFRSVDGSFSSYKKDNLEFLSNLEDASESLNSSDKYPTIKKILKKVEYHACFFCTCETAVFVCWLGA